MSEKKPATGADFSEIGKDYLLFLMLKHIKLLTICFCYKNKLKTI